MSNEGMMNEKEFENVFNKMNNALHKALSTPDNTEYLIPESLDKAICPDPCKHEFECRYDHQDLFIIRWICSKCFLEIDSEKIVDILNRFADIENWLNDKE